MKEPFKNITFRKLEENDLPLVWDWLNKDFVSQWYRGEKTYALQKIKLLNYINSVEPAKPFIFQFNNTDIGYIQFYRNDGFPEYQKEIDCYDNACGIDMFIGEKAFLHKGIGPMMILKFLDEIVFPQSNTEVCIMGPDPKNQAAIKAYSKVGFEHFKTVSKRDENLYLMRVSRSAIREKTVIAGNQRR